MSFQCTLSKHTKLITILMLDTNINANFIHCRTTRKMLQNSNHNWAVRAEGLHRNARWSQALFIWSVYIKRVRHLWRKISPAINAIFLCVWRFQFSIMVTCCRCKYLNVEMFHKFWILFSSLFKINIFLCTDESQQHHLHASKCN